MSIDTGIVTKLKALSTAAGDRVYSVRAAQNATMPYIVYQRVSAQREYSHDGASGLANPTYQITCCATTSAAARSLAAQVRAGIDGKAGTWDGVAVQAVFLLGDPDAFIELPGSESGYYAVTADYSIHHSES